jgi:Na+-transporting methylmalonyl-CoA/oxaloacetate decarboxylase gamma subunit
MVIAIIVAILAIILALACYGVNVVVRGSAKEKEKEEASKIAVSGKYAAALRPVAEALAEKKPSKEELEGWLELQGLSEEQKNKYLESWEKSIGETIKTVNDGDANGVTAYRVVTGERDKKICKFLHADNFITRNQISKNAEILPPYCLGSDSVVVPKLPWEKSDGTGGWKSVVPEKGENYGVPDWRQIV